MKGKYLEVVITVKLEAGYFMLRCTARHERWLANIFVKKGHKWELRSDYFTDFIPDSDSIALFKFKTAAEAAAFLKELKHYINAFDAVHEERLRELDSLVELAQ